MLRNLFLPSTTITAPVAQVIKLKKKQIANKPNAKKLRGAIAMRQALIKASKRRKQNFKEIYTYEDPTGTLPDEVRIR